MKYLFYSIVFLGIFLTSHALMAQDYQVECIGPAPAGPVAGPSTVQAGEQGVAFSVDLIERASSYTWTLPTGASIASGHNTRSITVDFSENAESGQITVAGVGCVYTGIAATFDITVNPVRQLAGNIRTATGQNIANVQVNMSTGAPALNTVADGNYAFNNLINGQSYSISPSKVGDVKDGLNVLDLALLRRHILAGIYMELPYQFTACDVDQSGTVTEADVQLLQRVILGGETSLPATWRFVPANYTHQRGGTLNVFTYNAWRTDFNEAITTLLNQDVFDADFIGIKIGDLNGDANTQ